jgi:TatD DNase family protein
MLAVQVMNIFDTHCHLQDPRLLPRIDEVLRRAEDAGVTRLLCCGVEENDWVQVLDLARRFPSVMPALGLHPLYVAQRSSQWFESLTAMLKDSGAVIGEIGLDHAVKPRNDKDQEDAFRRQLELAIELDRPVSIHCRQAWGGMPDILLSTGIPKAGAVVHSYSGGRDLVRPLTDAGICLSFSGSITRPNNRRGCEAAPLIPWERLLVETDAPDIMPMIEAKWPEKDAVNEPANLVYVVQKIAELRDVTPDEVAKRTWENARRIFDAKSTVGSHIKR